MSAVRDYARYELEMDQILERVFTTTIREMDLLYLSWLAEEREKSMKAKRPPPSKDQKAQHRKPR